MGLNPKRTLRHAQALLEPCHSAPRTEQLVDGAVAMLEQVPALAFSLADLLSSHSVASGGKRHRTIMLRLLECLAGAPLPVQPLPCRHCH